MVLSRWPKDIITGSRNVDVYAILDGPDQVVSFASGDIMDAIPGSVVVALLRVAIQGVKIVAKHSFAVGVQGSMTVYFYEDLVWAALNVDARTYPAIEPRCAESAIMRQIAIIHSRPGNTGSPAQPGNEWPLKHE